MDRKSISAARLHNGAVVVSAMVDGYRKACTYYGYSIREAIAAFMADCNE